MLAPSMCFRIEEALAEEHFLNQLEVFFGKQTIPQAQEATLRLHSLDTTAIANTTRLQENDHVISTKLTDNHFIKVNPSRPTSTGQAFESLRPLLYNPLCVLSRPLASLFPSLQISLGLQPLYYVVSPTLATGPLNEVNSPQLLSTNAE